MNVIELADQLWDGRTTVSQQHPFSLLGEATEIGEGTAFVPSFANVSVFATGEGLVLVDTGGHLFAQHAFEQVRSWSRDRVHAAVYSHGHIDHVFGVPLYEAEARSNGWPLPHVYAHAALPARFDRYCMTAGYNAAINRRQFGAPQLEWPTDYRYPDTTYSDQLAVEVGGDRFELHHARGETDDHTWTWVPSRRTVCSGDLFIWASPNAGNPQKVQRYPREWALALRAIAALRPEVLLPGHGVPLIGEDRVQRALQDTADLLDSLHDQTVAMMNAGLTLDDIIHTVEVPIGLRDRPYLQPVYDEPEFVVRNVWRLYGGWYDSNPAHLKPALDRELAAEVARFAGGAQALAQRAEELLALGSDRLAGHLAEMAVLAEPTPANHAARARVNQARAELEASTMAKGVFGWAARESEEAASRPE